jgi:hypothetical protein
MVCRIELVIRPIRLNTRPSSHKAQVEQSMFSELIWVINTLNLDSNPSKFKWNFTQK